MALLDARQVLPLDPKTPVALNATNPETETKQIGNDIMLGRGGYGDVLLKQYKGEACYVLSSAANFSYCAVSRCQSAERRCAA